MKPASMTRRTLEHIVGENRFNWLQTHGAGKWKTRAGDAGLNRRMLFTERPVKNHSCHGQERVYLLKMMSCDVKLTEMSL